MKKLIECVCESCDSEYTLNFDNSLVVLEHDETFCPFCGQKVDSNEENVVEEEVYPLDEDKEWY